LESTTLRGFQGSIDGIANLIIDFHHEMSGRDAGSRYEAALLMLERGGIVNTIAAILIPDGGATFATDFDISLSVTEPPGFAGSALGALGFHQAETCLVGIFQARRSHPLDRKKRSGKSRSAIGLISI
jgi:hypothetical protein